MQALINNSPSCKVLINIIITIINIIDCSAKADDRVTIPKPNRGIALKVITGTRDVHDQNIPVLSACNRGWRNY